MWTSFLELIGYESKPEPVMIELTVGGGAIKKVNLDDLNLKTVEYHFGDTTIPVQIKTGVHGMIHHCFETQQLAEEFLAAIRKDKISSLSSAEQEGFKKARCTETKGDPSYQGNNFFRVRLSHEQFKFFIKEHGHIQGEAPDNSPDNAR